MPTSPSRGSYTTPRDTIHGTGPRRQYSLIMYLFIPAPQMLGWRHRRIKMNKPTRFGVRVATIRKSCGIKQSGIDGIAQPILSKIECGTIAASAARIEQLAEAFERTPIELVRGTDREGYYVGARLKPHERMKFNADNRSVEHMVLGLLYVHYERVLTMFSALHGGAGIVPRTNADSAYIPLRTNCETLVNLIEQFRQGFSTSIYIPDHLEPENEFDDLLMVGPNIEELIRRSLREILVASQDYGGIKNTSKVDLEHECSLDQLDVHISNLAAECREFEKRFMAAKPV